ncbi:MAG: hypothetical protein IT337_12495 [Thermomicrobiales bacterium]|nr:hypothetical protein [Thermomicrobiales bacterium]
MTDALAAAATTATPAPAPGPGPTLDPASAQMPSGLDPKYWDATNGLKTDDLLKDFGELSAYRAQAEARLAEVPDKPEGYKLELPADFQVPEEFKEAFKLDESDPRLPHARALAKELGLPQGAFAKLIALDARLQIEAAQQAQAQMTAEMAKLGDKFPARREAVNAFVRANLTPEQAAGLEGIATSAAAFEAIEALIAKATTTRIPGTQPEPARPPQPVPQAERWYGSQQKAG